MHTSLSTSFNLTPYRNSRVDEGAMEEKLERTTESASKSLFNVDKLLQ